MARLRLGVDIDVNQTGNGLRAVSHEITQLTGVARGAGAALSGMLAPLGVAGGLSFAGITAGLGSLVKQGLEFNATMEQSRLGIGALIGAFGEVRDSSGKVLHDFNANLRVATDLQQKLKVAALQTTAEYTDMVQALQVGLGPALKAGFNADQVVTFTKTVTQAAAAIGLPMNQLGQEIRALFAGDIGIDSRLANLLFTDIPRNRIKGYVEELQKSGKFYDEMMRRMAAFAQAGERASGTFTGALSNLKDAFRQALGEGTQGQFGRVTELIRGMTSQIVTFDSAGKATFNPQFVSSVNDLAGAFVNLGSALAGIAKHAPTIINFMARLLSPDWSQMVLALAGAAGGFAVGGPAGALYGAGAGYAYGTAARQARENDFAAPNPNNPNDYTTRLQNFNRYLQTLPQSEREFTRNLWLGSDRSSTNNRLSSMPTAFGGEWRAAFDKQWSQGGGTGTPTLGPKTGSTAVEPDKARERAAASLREQLEAMRAQSRELDAQIRAAGELDAAKRAQLETEAKILGLLNQHGAFVRQLASQEKLTDAEREQASRQHLQNTAKEIQVLRSTAAREDAEAKKKAFDTNVESINDYLQKQREAGRKLWDDLIDESEKATQEQLRKLREPWEAFYRDTVGGGMKRALMSALDGGGLRGAFDAFFGSIFDSIGANFAKSLDGWMQQLADMAAGQKWTGKYNPDGSREMQTFDWGAKGKQAQGGLLALQSASALYGLYSNPAPSRGANMLSGAMAGGSIGFSYGALAGGITAIPAAIIGAVIGAIAGAFAPTVDGKNVRISGKGGAFTITGIGNAGEWGVDKLQTEINSAITSTAAALNAIFTDLPTAILEAIGAWHPDLTQIDVTGKADGKNWNEELENYLKQSLPQKVIDAYMPAVFNALASMGASSERLSQLAQLVGGQKSAEAIQTIKSYVEVLGGLSEIVNKFGGSPAGGRQRAIKANPFEIFYANLIREAEAGPLGEAGQLASRIAVLSQGFGDLTNDEQVARGKQILSLSQQLFGGIEQYLLSLRDLQKQLNDSIDKQIRDIDYDQITDPTKKADFLLAEQRKLRDELAKATNEQDINRIVAAMQANANELYTLLGRTPEAAEQAKQQLEDVRRIANERYKLIFDKAEQLTNDAFALVNSILKQLGQGLTNLGLIGLAPGTSTPDPNDPGIDPDLPWNKAATAAGVTASTFSDTLVPSISSAAAALNNFTKAASDAQAITVVVNVGDTKVDVQVAGTAEPLINSVESRITQKATTAAVEAMERRARRAASRG